MFVFIPGLPQRIAMIPPDPDNQSAQPYWTIIEIGEEWYLVDSKMLRGLIFY
jgi:hypothetical protein